MQQFILDNLWGIVIGAIGLAFTVGTVWAAVTHSLKQVSRDITTMRTEMKSRDEAHDDTLSSHDERLRGTEQRLAVLESKLDQSITHISEQVARIYDRLFGDKK